MQLTHLSIPVITFLLLSSARADDTVMKCKIFERLGTQKLSYTLEIESKLNHTVHYYVYARLIPKFFIRASGMTGGGARYLHLNLEDLTTTQQSITKVGTSGTLYFGARDRSVEMDCNIN